MRGAAWLIAGLGNPGPAYAATRHNVGYRVTETLAAAAGAAFLADRGARMARARMAGRDVVLIQPQEYMNACGPPVAEALGALGLGPDGLVVVHDDLDLEVGRVKIGWGGGDGGHRGLRSIRHALQGADFLRVRVGIGRPQGLGAADYVLSVPAGEEAGALRRAVARAAEAVVAVLTVGPAAAMNRFNPWPWPWPVLAPGSTI